MASIQILTSKEALEDQLEIVETMGRLCYASKKKPGKKFDPAFLTNLIRRGHESVLEHASLSVIYTTDRCVSHQQIRHRHCAYTQASQRFISYNKSGRPSLEFEPVQLNYITDEVTRKKAEDIIESINKAAEEAYNELTDMGVRAEGARRVLPQSVTTKLGITANLREWRHILKLRTDKHAEQPIRELSCQMWEYFNEHWPWLVADLEPYTDDF